MLYIIQFQQLERHSLLDNTDKSIMYYSSNTNVDSFHNQTLSDVD